MSQKFVFSAVPGTKIVQQLANPGTVQAVDLWNGTPFDLDWSGFGVNGVTVIAAGTGMRYFAKDENSGTVSILPVNNVNVTGTGVINMVVYYMGEVLPQGQFPATIPPQIVQAKVSTVTNLVNDGSSVGTQIIESTPAGAASSTISILNDGTVVIKGDVGGVLTTLLQLLPGAAAGASSVILSDAARRLEALGSFLVDGASTFTGLLTANGHINTDLLRDLNGNTNVDMSLGTGEVKFPGIIDPNQAGTVINGTSGTMTCYTPFWGSAFKLLLVKFAGYINSAIGTFNFPSAMARGAFGTPNFGATTVTGSFFNSGVAQNTDQISALSASGSTFTAATTFKQGCLGFITTTVSQFQMGTNTVAINGNMWVVGQ